MRAAPGRLLPAALLYNSGHFLSQRSTFAPRATAAWPASIVARRRPEPPDQEGWRHRVPVTTAADRQAATLRRGSPPKLIALANRSRNNVSLLDQAKRQLLSDERMAKPASSSPSSSTRSRVGGAGARRPPKCRPGSPGRRPASQRRSDLVGAARPPTASALHPDQCLQPSAQERRLLFHPSQFGRFG